MNFSKDSRIVIGSSVSARVVVGKIVDAKEVGVDALVNIELPRPCLMAPGSANDTMEVYVVKLEDGSHAPLLVLNDDAYFLWKAPYDVDVREVEEL